MKFMITGGAGYIGSHIALQALVKGHSVMIFDNMSNVRDRTVTFLKSRGASIVQGDIVNRVLMTDVMRRFRPDIVIHLAALKDAAESEKVPLQYYKTNVDGTLSVLQAMEDADIRRLIFSSSASVYGDSHLPLTESSPLGPVSTYGKSKMMAEIMVEDFARRGRTAITFRYFNPVASNVLIPQLHSNTFMSNLTGSAFGRKDGIVLYNEGKNVRDFIHVMDLADAHFNLDGLFGHHVFNLGSGLGSEIRDVLATMEQVSKTKIRRTMSEAKRIADIEYSVADMSKFKESIGDWMTNHTVEQMCFDAWMTEILYLSSEL